MSEEAKAKKATAKAKAAEPVLTDEVNNIPLKLSANAVVTADKAESFVYVGPNLPNGLLKKGSIFNGTKSEVMGHLDHIIQKYPEVKHLIVLVGELPIVKVRIQEGGNLLASNIMKLLTRINNKEV